MLRRLREAARAAAEHNYARYSGFMIVAAVETTDGQVFGGTNIEVANWTLTKHAEEMAIMQALATRGLREPDAENDRWLKTLYVSGATPCGSCRQFAYEWATEDAVCVVDDPATGKHEEFPLAELLPEAFGPADLGVDRRPADPAGGQLPTGA